QRYERVEDRPVADGPRDAADCGDERGRYQPANAPLPVSRPSGEQRQNGEQRRVGHQRQSPEQAIKNPRAQGSGLGDPQGRPEEGGRDEGRNRRVPQALVGHLDGIREDGPEPGGASGKANTANSLRGEVQRNADQTGEADIYGYTRYPRCKGIWPE